MDLGRPKVIQLAILVDRPGRELPIQADFIGVTVETDSEEQVEARFEATDGEQDVALYRREA